VSTARTVLHLLSMLARAEHGMRADDVAEALGKSTSTAYNLLDTLCQERFVVHAADGSYHLTTEAAGFVPAAGVRDLPTGLGGILDELFARTRKRVYLAAAHSGQVVIPLARGRQGMPLIPGLGPCIGENAHALALGKVALSLLHERGLERYIRHGLRAFTPATIVSEGQLRGPLSEALREVADQAAQVLSAPTVPALNPAGAASPPPGELSSRAHRPAPSTNVQHVGDRNPIVPGASAR
jgi:DNA-binding IclR family transcriptional regulator